MDKAAESWTSDKRKAWSPAAIPALREPFEKEEVDNETKRHAETVRYQKQACRRLDNCLDAHQAREAKLDEEKERPKPEEEAAAEEKKNGDEKPEQEEAEGSAAGTASRRSPSSRRCGPSSSTSTAQTKDFAERNPDGARLNEGQRAELRQIQEDQGRLMELFQQIIQEHATPPRKKEPCHDADLRIDSCSRVPVRPAVRDQRRARSLLAKTPDKQPAKKGEAKDAKPEAEAEEGDNDPERIKQIISS